MSNIDEYINGSDEYAEVLRIVRQHLCSAFSMEYGAIAFYKFNPNDKKAWAKVFPINAKIIDKHFPDNEDIRKTVLQLINTDRDYKEFYYYKQFRKEYTTTRHFDLELSSKKDQLEHTQSSIEGKEWIEFVNTIDKKNVLDQLFYSSNESKYKAIPLPILYSPATLIVVPKDAITAPEQIDKIITPVAESVHFYLFNRLLTELRDDVRLDKIGTDKQKLIQEFLSQLVEVAIPIKYEFNGKEYQCFDWYGNWETNLSAIIELTLADEKVKMYMPTFCWHDGKMLHTKDEYKVREQQVKETIENIFKLIHSNWKAINDTKRQGRYVLKQIVEDSGLNLHSLESFGKEIDKIKNAVERAVNITDEDYTKTLGAVASKEVRLRKIYKDGIETGYNVLYGDDLIVEYKYSSSKKTKKIIKHFGYDALEELYNANGSVIDAINFSFVEDVRSALPAKSESTNQEPSKKEGNSPIKENEEYGTGASAESYAQDAISTVLALKCMLEKIIEIRNLKSFQFTDFVQKVKNINVIKEIVSKQKKDIDQLKTTHSRVTGSYKDTDDIIHTITLTDASIFINILHSYFVKNITEYNDWHKKNGTTETARVLRAKEQNNGVQDSDVTQRIAQNISQLCNKLIRHQKHGTIFKNNFEQAELDYDKSNRNFKYDKTKIDIANTLEWIFE
jgi:hypothetical protein